MSKSTFEEFNILQDNESGEIDNEHEVDEGSNVDETSPSYEFDDNMEALNELMKCKFLLNEYESRLLRIPIISLYFSQRNKKLLPFEARLLPFSCRLPKKMTRGPFLFGEGNILKRIDEDSSEGLFDFEEMESNESILAKKHDSIETLQTDLQRKGTFNDVSSPSSFDGINELCQRHTLDTIYEASAIDERIFDFPLTRQQRKVICETEARLQAIAEVRRIHEMAEESPNDEEYLDARIWESDETPFYCRKVKGPFNE